MKPQINLHPTKIWAFIYPLYANEIVFGKSYEKLADIIDDKFVLSPKQWEAILNEWEFIHGNVLTY